MCGSLGACVVAGGRAWLPGGGAWVVVGGHAWLPGACVVARGHAWLLGGACVVAGGHAWLLGGLCGEGGMRGERGACVAKGSMHGEGGACVGYDKIRRYDQCAGGTHSTGMHSCSGVCEQNSVVISIRADDWIAE